MKAILTGATLMLALAAANAQTTPMPNANQTPEGSNNLPNATTTTSPGSVGPNGTTRGSTPGASRSTTWRTCTTRITDRSWTVPLQ